MAGGRIKGSKNTPKRGMDVPKLLKEAKELRDQLLFEKEERRKANEHIQHIEEQLRQFKLNPRPKYSASPKLLLTEEMVKDAGDIVSQGIFEYSQIASFLGINRNTFINWIKEGQSDKYSEEDLRTQLVQLIEYRKQIFFIMNQNIITKEAKGDPANKIRPNANMAKWNMESRFKNLRVNANQNNIIINDDFGRPVKQEVKDQEVIAVKKELSIYLQQNAFNDDHYGDEEDYGSTAVKKPNNEPGGDSGMVAADVPTEQS